MAIPMKGDIAILKIRGTIDWSKVKVRAEPNPYYTEAPIDPATNTNHDKRLPQELTPKERRQRAHAYGIRHQAWVKKMKELYPDRAHYFKRKRRNFTGR